MNLGRSSTGRRSGGGLLGYGLLAAALASACLLAACAGGPAPGPGPGSDQGAKPGAVAPAKPASKGPRMFWTLKGPKGSANQGTLYVQGTIHVGADELYPLAPAVIDALRTAQVVMAELSPGDLERSAGLVLHRMTSSLLPNGKTLYDYLSDKEEAALIKIMGEENLRRFAVFSPWVCYSSIDLFLGRKSGLDAEKGVDMALYTAAEELGKTVAGVETAEDQLDIFTQAPFESQLAILKDAIREAEAYPDQLHRLYKAYKSDDRAQLERILKSSLSAGDASSAAVAAFNDKLFKKRNQAWADKLHVQLSAGKTVFLFAGTGHFLGEENVLALLKARGYTLYP